MFVEDCIDHTLWLWQHPEASGIYNSGTGAARTFADLARACFAGLGLKPAMRFIDMPAGLARQYQNFTQSDMSRLHAAGYPKPATSLEQGVRLTLDILAVRDRPACFAA